MKYSNAAEYVKYPRCYFTIKMIRLYKLNYRHKKKLFVKITAFVHYYMVLRVRMLKTGK